jgi:hypothetical protein
LPILAIVYHERILRQIAKNWRIESQVEIPQTSEANVRIAKQSWRIQAKPLIMQLLEIIPEDEEALQYIQIVATELNIKN